MPDSETRSGRPAVRDEVLAEAAEWYALLRSGRAGTRDTARWRAWLAAAPDHRAAWRDVESIDQGMAALQAAPEPRLAADRLMAAQSRLRGRRRLLAGVAGLAVMGAGGWLAGRAALPAGGVPALLADRRTGVGQIRDWTLEDGSRVWLNTASALDVAMTPTLRRLTLVAGDMFIATGRDPARPLVVDTPQGRLRALGTRFSVEHQGDATHVAVFDGQVELRPAHGAPPLVLPAGRQTTFTRDAIAPPQAADPARQAWTNGILLVADARLGEVVQTLRRHRRGQIQITDRIASLRVYGSFPLDATNRALDMLAATLPIRVTQPWPWLTRVEPLQHLPGLP